jgi:hypothetical protein
LVLYISQARRRAEQQKRSIRSDADFGWFLRLCSATTSIAHAKIIQLNTCFTKLNVNEVFDNSLAGLSDSDEVKLLALMVIQRLAALADGIVAARLDELVDSFENVVKPIVPAKDDTGQDVQRKVRGIFSATPG